jgi:ring-1,2-phenylacetyl-CoA epoxidase subunit PaaD
MVTARAIAESVLDPELPQLTLGDLGIVRDVSTVDGRIVVSITPTYSGCPALQAIRTDLAAQLDKAGFGEVEIHTVLRPAWTTDWITESGREKLAIAGIAPPRKGPVPLTLFVRCPNCGSTGTEEISHFSGTACKALRRCRDCREPFEHVKEF